MDYPYLLSQIYAPPKKLYVLGNAQILRERSIAIAGGRDASNYGKSIARKLAYNLGKNNIITVSGLARGIDTFCHIGSVEANARTIAVLANGLDMIYPAENRNLAIRILKCGGALISEYNIGEKPLKQNFPARNRIISGLCESTVIVEAKKESEYFTIYSANKYGVIDAEGNVCSVEIFSESSEAKTTNGTAPVEMFQQLAGESERIISGMPQWQPAMKDGKAVATSITLPITFMLQ